MALANVTIDNDEYKRLYNRHGSRVSGTREPNGDNILINSNNLNVRKSDVPPDSGNHLECIICTPHVLQTTPVLGNRGNVALWAKESWISLGHLAKKVSPTMNLVTKIADPVYSNTRHLKESLYNGNKCDYEIQDYQTLVKRVEQEIERTGLEHQTSSNLIGFDTYRVNTNDLVDRGQNGIDIFDNGVASNEYHDARYAVYHENQTGWPFPHLYQNGIDDDWNRLGDSLTSETTRRNEYHKDTKENIDLSSKGQGDTANLASSNCSYDIYDLTHQNHCSLIPKLIEDNISLVIRLQELENNAKEQESKLKRMVISNNELLRENQSLLQKIYRRDYFVSVLERQRREYLNALEATKEGLRTTQKLYHDNKKHVSEVSRDLKEKFLEFMETTLKCCICHEMLINAVSIDCHHTFCRSCIENWSDASNDTEDFQPDGSCPVCRHRFHDIDAIPLNTLNHHITEFVSKFTSVEYQNERSETCKTREFDCHYHALVQDVDTATDPHHILYDPYNNPFQYDDDDHDIEEVAETEEEVAETEDEEETEEEEYNEEEEDEEDEDEDEEDENEEVVEEEAEDAEEVPDLMSIGGDSGVEEDVGDDIEDMFESFSSEPVLENMQIENQTGHNESLQNEYAQIDPRRIESVPITSQVARVQEIEWKDEGFDEEIYSAERSNSERYNLSWSMFSPFIFILCFATSFLFILMDSCSGL